MPRPSASWMIARTMLPASSSSATSRTNERSIFRMSTGRCFSRERGVARSEVVERDTEALRVELPQQSLRPLRIRHGGRLRDLEHQVRRVRAEPLDRAHHLLHDLGLPELSRRQVEAHLQRETVAAPLCVLAAELLDHPVADYLDQAHLLRERDELSRRDQAAVRVLPAQARLHSHHLAAPER